MNTSYKNPEAVNTLLGDIRARLLEAAAGDPLLLHHMRRRVFTRLSYDERGAPSTRRALKRKLFTAQGGRCFVCQCELEPNGAYAVLDRRVAHLGYTEANVDLKCGPCDRSKQEANNFT